MTIRALATFVRYHYDRDPMPIQACLSWTDRDPVAVSIEFYNPLNDDGVVWVLSRDLLAAGVLAPAGVGDVHIVPVDGELRVTLDSPSGHADFAVDVEVICSFLDETYRACPGGEEFAGIDLEAELACLLKEESA